MLSPSRRRTAPLIAATAALTVLASLAGAGAASASHFRASGPDFVISGNQATWTVTTAWESGSGDSFVGLGGTTDVLAISSYADTPGSGTTTGVSLEVTSETETDEPLYAQTVEVFSGDLSTLPDGLYEVYVSSCCRVSDIVNSAADEFSQWVRFSKLGSTYSVAPRLTTPLIYSPLALDGSTTTVNYAATGASTWNEVLDATDPYFGSNTLPCSSFAGGVLQVGSAFCTGGDVYSAIYTTGTFWAFKTVIADADGRQSVAETLFRVESIPEPYIDSHSFANGGTTANFVAIAPDTIVNSWTVTCTNAAVPADVVSGTSSSLPIVVNGFTQSATYNCSVSATNGAGTGTTDPDYTIETPSLALALEFGPGDFYAGNDAIIQGSGLDANSDYDLTMYSDPIVLATGTADGNGDFEQTVVIPQEACIQGRHELRLTGLSQGEPVTASQYVEVDANCLVVKIQLTPWGTEPAELAETGTADSAPLGLAGGLVLAMGLALTAIARRRRAV